MTICPRKPLKKQTHVHDDNEGVSIHGGGEFTSGKIYDDRRRRKEGVGCVIRIGSTGRVLRRWRDGAKERNGHYH